MISSSERHLTSHEYRAAQIELRNAIRLAPEIGKAHRLLGVALLHAGDPVAAENSLREALALAERPDEVLPVLSMALIHQDKPDRLIEEFAGQELQDPTAIASLRANLGQAWLMRGDLARAAEAFVGALSAVPGYPPARLGQARIAALDGRRDEATSIADALISADPELVEGHGLKAQLLVSQGQHAAAAVSLERIIAIDPGNVTARTALASMRIGAHEFDKAKALLSSGSDPRLTYLRGLLALRLGELQKAKDEVASLLRRVPEQSGGLTLAGEIELRSNSLTLAEGYLLRAVRASPTAPTPRRLLAATHMRQGQPAKAVEVLQPLLRQPDPKDSQLLMLAGEAYLASGDATRANELFQRSTSDRETEAVARLRLGQTALARGDVDRGIGELEASSALDSEQPKADLVLIALHMRRHEPEKALAAAQSLVKKRPGDPLGYILAGRAELDNRRPASARQHFVAALGIRPDYAPAIRGLVDVDMAEGHPDAARGRLDALIAKDPGDERLLIARAELHEQMGELADAGKALRRAIEANPRSPTPYAALVQYHLRRREPAAALAVATEGVAANPALPRFVELRGDAQDAAGARSEAVRTFQSLVLLEPKMLGPLLKLAASQSKLGDVDASIRSLRQAQKLAPDHEGVARELVAANIQASRFDDALNAAKALATRNPRAAVGHLLEGEVQTTRRKWPEAERAYRTALSIEPSSSDVAIKLCRMLHAAGRRSDSASLAKDWIARRPTDMPVRMYLADAALKEKDYKGAASQYETVLSLAPGNTLALNNLAWVLGQMKDPRALGLAERAVELAPNSAPALDTLGMLHLERGDPGKAMSYLTRVQSLAPDRKDLRLHYAMGLLRVGRTAEGKAALRELASSAENFSGKSEIPALLGRL